MRRAVADTWHNETVPRLSAAASETRCIAIIRLRGDIAEQLKIQNQILNSGIVQFAKYFVPLVLGNNTIQAYRLTGRCN